MLILTDPTELVDQIEACGVTPPSEMVAIADDYTIVQRLGSVGATVPAAWGGPAAAVRSAFTTNVEQQRLKGDTEEEMRDAALRAAVQEQLTEIYRDLGPRLSRGAAALARRHGDDLIVQAQEGFDKAAHEVAEVVAVLGLDPDPKDVLDAKGKEGKAMKDAWNRRVSVLTTLDAAASIRQVLAIQKYGVAQEGSRPQVEWFLDPDEEWSIAKMTVAYQAFTSTRGLSDQLAAVIDAGYKLHLNTAAESAAVVEEANANPVVVDPEQQAEEQARAQEKINRLLGVNKKASA